MLPTDNPRLQGVLHKFERLLLNIRKARLLKITDHVWRYSEDSSYFINLKFSCFQKLCFIWGDGDRRVFHAFFQNSYLMRIVTREAFGPAFSDSFWIFYGTGILQNTSRCGTVCKELSTVFLCGDSKSDSVLGHSNRRVTDQTVKAEARNMENIGRFQDYGSIFHGRCI